MVSTVRSRPNHYEVLGLTPAASDAEILQAFAREMSMFRARPMAAVAQISVAYETLRNPAKRRAYDASLGLSAEPEPSPAPVAAAPPSPFISAAPQARREGLPERGVGSFIAESLREPEGADEPSPEPQPEAEPRPEAEAEASFRPDLGELLAGGGPEEKSATAGWKRPAMAVGALVLAVGLAGALLGLRGGETPQPAEPDMAIALPEATPAQDIAALLAPPPVAAPGAIEAPPAQPAAVAEPRTEPRRPPLQIAAVDDRQPEAGQAAESRPEETATEQAVAEAPATGAVAAALPLPNAAIARTIGRIGYACGEVASTEAVEGEAAGVFKVTCTSGQSYRAAPVRGRYHFRRWDRQ